jgi:thiol-disulfide isomerase/thioredoxin
MKKIRRANQTLIVILFLAMLPAMAHATMYAQVNQDKQYSDTKASFPDIMLAAPAAGSDREYLGIPGNKVFKIGDIGARVVIIEVFSFYCPICQKQAGLVNELHTMIQSNPGLKDKIKIIGIAATNNPFETKSYKESHRVPFPVFSDEEGELAVALNIKYTPTFIGVRLGGKKPEQFYLRPGAFTDPAQFLREILKTSGIE